MRNIEQGVGGGGGWAGCGERGRVGGGRRWEGGVEVKATHRRFFISYADEHLRRHIRRVSVEMHLEVQVNTQPHLEI